MEESKGPVKAAAGSSLLGPQPAVSELKPGKQTTDELNAALIAQMMEEDENEHMVQQLQNEAFGGGMPPSQNAAMNDDFNAGEGGVRQADHQQEEQLIGGSPMLP